MTDDGGVGEHADNNLSPLPLRRGSSLHENATTRGMVYPPYHLIVVVEFIIIHGVDDTPPIDTDTDDRRHGGGWRAAGGFSDFLDLDFGGKMRSIFGGKVETANQN